MNCGSAKRRSHEYVDQRLRNGELSRFEEHLSACEPCEQQTYEVGMVRTALQQLPKVNPPAELRIRLRVQASQERRLVLEADGSPWRRLWTSWRFRLNELMRPLTIPATGGLLSSVFLFGALAFTIMINAPGVVYSGAYEVPLLYSDRVNANLIPADLRSSVVLTLSLDGNGRITDYAVRDGANSFIGNATRLRQNNISLPEIPSVLALAQPISSDIRISLTPIVFRQ